MPMKNEVNREQLEGVMAPTRQKSDDPYATAELEPRCIRCNAPVESAICGRKLPCPSCGYPYPMGDCSDLAEN